MKKNQNPESLNSPLKMHFIPDNLIDGLIILNQKGIIESANLATAELFGYETGQIVGKEFTILLSEDYQKFELKEIAGKRREVLGKRKDDSTLSLYISVSEIKTEKEPSYLCIVHEIICQKTKGGENQQKYILELEKNNASLQDFAYASSHDLQEPLRKIQAFGERLKMKEFEKLSEEGKDYLTRMLTATARMQMLIDGLLSFTRITSKAIILEDIDLNQLVKEVLSDLEISIEKAQATITFEKLPVIEGDPIQLRQVFQNLISNSIKFRKENEKPAIHISAETTDNQFIQLYFKDNGIGFDEKYGEKIFNIFQRLEGQKYEGSGIGLAICRKIAIRHRGDITVKSTQGKGSTFIVKLPVKQLM